MTIGTIVTLLLSAQEAEWLAPQARELAGGLDAHLTAVHPRDTQIPYAGVGAAYGVMPLIEPELLDWQTAEAEAIERVFDAGAWASQERTEFRAQAPGPADARSWLLENIHAADLVILGRNDPRVIRQNGRRLQEAAIRDGGRPVLLLPEGAGFAAPARRVLIGWSATREAARAAHDVLSLAAPDAGIVILHVHDRVDTASQGPDGRHDLAAALNRLGHDVELLDRDAPAGETGEMLLRAAQETGAELVATGAFGHSRAYDFVIGAVTRHLLDHAEMPVLLSK